jgi:hypothetical protein
MVGELVAAAGEELDPVVRHRVVRRGDHHAEVGPEVAVRKAIAGVGSTPASRTSTPADARPATGRGEQELTGGAPVGTHHGGRPVPLELADSPST